jgi:hypothetical protein
VRETAFVSHRATCEHCRTKPNPCETGTAILIASMQQINAGTKKETHATAE